MIIKAEGKPGPSPSRLRPRRTVGGGVRRPDRPDPGGGKCGRRFPILAEECIEDYLTFDTQGLSGEHFALKVRGESMMGLADSP